jgi:glutathione synthase/RimK-type ligase-like ATP-grasp enzyme
MNRPATRPLAQPISDSAFGAWLNRECFCLSLDGGALERALSREIGDAGFVRELLAARPNLFSQVSVFVSRADYAAMEAVMQAVEAAARLPRYREAVLGWAPGIAQVERGTEGVFMGYDFHLSESGPRLIEVNTNAGGAFLNAPLAAASRACCKEVEGRYRRPHGDFEAGVIAMFRREWSLERGEAPLERIAIVDDGPREQYLYPEFVLARETFRRHGIDAVICDPAELHFDGAALHAGAAKIDLVYNRLVDFDLDEPGHAALSEAYLAGAVVLTPSPRHHALLADKRNLTLLSSPETMAAFGLAQEHLAALAAVPRTQMVTAENADALWQARKHLFFKPVAGHGAKAVYRGEKLTRSVWEMIRAGGYVAQEAVAPPARSVMLEGENRPLKFDLRLYTYDGQVLLAAARVYQGQTTNFRTLGGGFAPVLVFDAAREPEPCP